MGGADGVDGVAGVAEAAISQESAGPARYIAHMSPSSAQPWEFRAEIVLTEERSRQLRAEFVAASPEWGVHFARERRDLAKVLLGGIIALVGGLLMLLYSPTSFLTVTGVGAMQLMLLAIGVASAVVWARRSWTLRKISAASVVTNNAARAPTTCRFHLTTLGIRVSTPDIDRTRPWANYCDVLCLPGFVVIDAVEYDSVVIPKDNFASAGECQRFVSAVRALIEAGAGASPVLIREFLKDHPFACPRCRYDLRGNDGLMCPECGHTLTLADVPHARLLRSAVTIAQGGPIAQTQGESSLAP